MVLCCDITIGALHFNAVHSVEIRSTWKRFTDTAIIRIPRKLYYLKDGKPQLITKPIKELIKTGDPVEIKLGYNKEYITEFKGYVARSVRPGWPYEIQCEDEMWQLKRKSVSISKPNLTIREILQTVAPGYQMDAPDEVFGDISMKNVTPVMVFNELRKRAGLYTFFREDRLVCGQVYDDPKLTKTVANFAFGKNIIDSSLQYVEQEDARVKIYASSTQKNGAVIREEIGEEGGDVIRFNAPFNFSKKNLNQFLERKLRDIKNKGGYDGDLRSFGFPNVVHGQRVRVQDTIYEQRDTQHFVDDVEVLFSPSSGYRRIINPGKLI